MFRSASLLIGCLLALPLAAQPRLTKSYNPPSMSINNTTLLTFVITNTVNDPAQTGMNFSDTLPQGLEIVNMFPSNCNAGFVISSDRRTFTFTNGKFNANIFGGPGDHSCSVTVQVRAAACRVYANTPNNLSGVSNLDVSQVNAPLTVTGCMNAPPLLTKAFAPAAIPSTGTSTLMFTLTNSAGDPAQNGIAFNDSLPAGLAVDAVLPKSCTGTVTISSDNRMISFNGQLGPGQHACQIPVRVKSTGLCGTQLNKSSNFNGVTNLDVTNAMAGLEVTQCASGFAVRKIVDGAPSGFNADFTFLMQCTTPAGFYQKTVTVAWPAPGFVAINDIPPGSQCTVAEGPLPTTLPANTNWSGLPQYDPSGPITVAANSEVKITNTLRACNDAGKVTVRTTLQGLPQNFTGTFTGMLQCWSGGTMTNHPITLNAPNALSMDVLNLPRGSSCTFLETAQPPLTGSLQWSSPQYTPPFGSVMLDDACCKEITVINEARTCCVVNGVTTCSVTSP